LTTRLSFLLLFTCLSIACTAQVVVSGTVYDITKKTPIEAVSVLSTSGRGTFTDSAGHYSITVRETDSIYFSFLNKPTPKYPVTSIQNIEAFDISILKKIQELPAVFVKQRSYRMDSLQNRQDYSKVFEYRKPGIRTSTLNMPGSVGVGVDINELINMFKFKKIRSTLAFQKRLLLEEQDKYVNHRFNKGLVKKLTGLEAPAIDNFIRDYKPTYQMALQLNDLEFGQFIIEAFKLYKAGIKVDYRIFPVNKYVED
jgi:hypothetical protein